MSRKRRQIEEHPGDPPNCYQQVTTPGKLRGQYYTPDELVDLIVEGLHLTPRHWVIDPACGDGRFLRGVVAAVSRRFHGADPNALARHWAACLVGLDIDPAAVAAARQTLRQAFCRHMGAEIPEASLNIHQADALQFSRLTPLLRCLDVPGPREDERVIVLGNPPYVEAKRLSRDAKAVLRARYPDAAAGAPDLYLYFLHVCLGWLRPADTLAFVLPNKLLVNANAQTIREQLLDEGRLRGLWLATQAALFPNTAVYPIVLFASGPDPSKQEPVEIVPITRAPAPSIAAQGLDSKATAERLPECGRQSAPGAAPGNVPSETDWRSPSGKSPRARAKPEPLLTSVCGPRPSLARGEAVIIDPRWYRRTQACAFFPLPENPLLRHALDTLLRPAADARLARVLDIRWTVSFHRAGLRELYVLPDRPDEPCVRPFIGGGPFAGNGEVTRYHLRWAGWWIRYDTAELQARKNPLPDLRLFEPPKIVICQNGRTLRAAYDDQGFVLKDTFLCGSIRDLNHPLCRHPRALVGLLCSRAVHFFYAHVFYGGHVNGGYLHFLRSFLMDIPIGAWTDEKARSCAELVMQRETATTTAEREELEARIESRVSETLGLTDEEHAAITAWAAGDQNWQARERVRAPRSPVAGRQTKSGLSRS